MWRHPSVVQHVNTVPHYETGADRKNKCNGEVAHIFSLTPNTFNFRLSTLSTCFIKDRFQNIKISLMDSGKLTYSLSRIPKFLTVQIFHSGIRNTTSCVLDKPVLSSTETALSTVIKAFVTPRPS